MSVIGNVKDLCITLYGISSMDFYGLELKDVEEVEDWIREATRHSVRSYCKAVPWRGVVFPRPWMKFMEEIKLDVACTSGYRDEDEEIGLAEIRIRFGFGCVRHTFYVDIRNLFRCYENFFEQCCKNSRVYPEDIFFQYYLSPEEVTRKLLRELESRKILMKSVQDKVIGNPLAQHLVHDDIVNIVVEYLYPMSLDNFRESKFLVP